MAALTPNVAVLPNEDRRRARRLGLVVALCCLLLMRGALSSSDENSMFHVSQSLVERQNVEVPNEPLIAVQATDGKFVSKYGIGVPLLAAPFVAVGWAVGGLTGNRVAVEMILANMVTAFGFGLLAAVAFRYARRWGARHEAATLVAVGLVGGTFLFPYAKEFWSDPVVAAALLLALERVEARAWPAVGWALGGAVLLRPQAVAVLPVVLFLAHRRGGSAAVRSALPGLVVAGMVTVAYSLVRFGDPLTTGYNETFSTPFLVGARGLLTDPGRSIFLFAPIVILSPLGLMAMWKRRGGPDAVVTIVALAAMFFVMDATWAAWMGGVCWGPRLLIPMLPILVVPLAVWASSSARLLLLAVMFAVGCAVSLPAVLAPSTLQNTVESGSTPEPMVGKQWSMVGSVIENTFDGTCPGLRPGFSQEECTLPFWQVRLTQLFGMRGAVVATLASGAILFAVTSLARSFGRERAPRIPARNPSPFVR